MVLTGAFEVLFVFVSRPAVDRGIDAPVKLFGILSVLSISGGLFPQYWEIYKLGEVMGVSYTFICIDMLGGLLNDLSLAFAEHFDGLAAASYTAVIVSFSFPVSFLAAHSFCRCRCRHKARPGSVSCATGRLDDSIEMILFLTFLVKRSWIPLSYLPPSS